MNRLTLEKRTEIIGLLVEGTSLRATSRLADVSINEDYAEIARKRIEHAIRHVDGQINLSL